MAAIIPEHCGLESIGSVAANFARSSNDEDFRYSLGRSARSAEASMIRDMHGDAVYETYLNEIQQNTHGERHDSPPSRPTIGSRRPFLDHHHHHHHQHHHALRFTTVVQIRRLTRAFGDLWDFLDQATADA
ncbi:hypothetical protein MMC07_001684 [Pseudocyphellaria aurata]|nr:hypothetical protein [Pseudocyphellaria aurata]